MKPIRLLRMYRRIWRATDPDRFKSHIQSGGVHAAAILGPGEPRSDESRRGSRGFDPLPPFFKLNCSKIAIIFFNPLTAGAAYILIFIYY